MVERGLICSDIGCWLEVLELSTEDDGEPKYFTPSAEAVQAEAVIPSNLNISYGIIIDKALNRSTEIDDINS